MIEITALAFAAGVLSCLFVHPVIWPRVEPRKRDARGRYAKEPRS